MTTTEIVPFDRNAALAVADNCELILSDALASDVIASSFPGNLDPQRRRDKTLALIREATIHIANSDACDKICRCTGASVLDCLVSCARLGLSLTKALGHAYLIPFGGVCTLMPGYKGFIKLIVDAGHIRRLETVVVYKKDEFSFYRDEKGPHLRHVPDPESQGDNSQVRLVYLVATTKDGGSMFEMMNNAELGKVRKSSKQPNGPAYTSWPTEMKRKAVIRRFEKSVPKGMDTPAEERLAEALDLDNSQFDQGKLAEYKAMSDEHSRSLKEQAMAPVVGEESKPVTDDERKCFRIGVKQHRAKCESSMTDDEFIACVIEAEFGLGALELETLDRGQYDALVAAMQANKFDWATAELLPSNGDNC